MNTTPKKRNILLVNLGSPDDPSPSAVGRYLREFLMDAFVIDIPYVLRWILVKLLIVPRRKFRSSHAYKKVWTPLGSPLIINTKKFAEKLQSHRPDWNVRWAMRYGNPSFTKVFTQLLNESDGLLEIVPLYPQYAKSSTGTCWNLAYKLARKHNALRRVRVLREFYDHPSFIESFIEQASVSMQSFKPDHVLFSFHGLPEHHIQELDMSGSHCLKKPGCCDQITDVNVRCYRAQSFATARRIADGLKLPADGYSVSFQSRLGSRPWIKPYTDVRLTELANSGTKHVLVICASFVADCLETLEEIQIQAKGDFNHVAGGELNLVPSLNDTLKWIESFSDMMDDSDVRWEYVEQWKQMSMTRNL